MRAADLMGAAFEKALVVQVVDVAEQDADGDGLTLAEENALGTSDNNRDSDGDGDEDGAEYSIMGTDPADPNSGPFRLSIEVNQSGVTLRWKSAPGINCVVEHRADLKRGMWMDIPGGQVTGTGGFVSIGILNDPAFLKQFYCRVKIP